MKQLTMQACNQKYMGSWTLRKESFRKKGEEQCQEQWRGLIKVRKEQYPLNKIFCDLDEIFLIRVDLEHHISDRKFVKKIDNESGREK